MPLLDLLSLWERLPATITPASAGLTLATFAPTIATPRLVTPGKASLVLTTFAPVVTAIQSQPEVTGGGSVPRQRYVVSRPLQRLPAPRSERRPVARPVWLAPNPCRLRLRAHRPLVRLSDHQTVTPRPGRLRLAGTGARVAFTANQIVTPGTGRFLYGVSDDFWDLNRFVLLAEIDPDLVEELWKNDSKPKLPQLKLPVGATGLGATPFEG